MIKSFDEVFEDVTKLGVKMKTDEYHPIGKYQIIDQGQEAVAGYSDLEDGVFGNVPAIVFGDHTRIVKYVDQLCGSAVFSWCRWRESTAQSV